MSRQAINRFLTRFQRVRENGGDGTFAIAGSFVCFVALAIWTVLVELHVFLAADVTIMRTVSLLHSAEMDIFTGIVNYVAAAEVTLLAMLCVSATLWWRGHPVWRAVSPLLFLLTIPIEFALKYGINQPLPSATFYRETFRYGLNSIDGVLHSFPSGHGTRSMYMAILVWYLVRSYGPTSIAVAVRLGLVLLVILSALAKTYQGHHWPSDMFGGFLLGAAFGLATIAVLAGSTRTAHFSNAKRPAVR